ncbi:glutathione peroxidase [Oceanococcus atlanticus]|nr:hypothetical protein [Oceanococcus atlanticus]
MLKILGLSLATLMWLSPAPVQAAEQPLCQGLASPGLLMGGGKDKPLCDWFEGKAVLVVNTASKCGLTPQFEGLEALHKRFHEQGLTILGFPSDNFLGQEYDNPEKTAEICYRNYGVTFPMFTRIDVKGKKAHPLFQRLAEQTRKPSWNFHKYLIKGDQVTDFGPRTKPDDETLIKAIEQALSEQTAAR